MSPVAGLGKAGDHGTARFSRTEPLVERNDVSLQHCLPESSLARHEWSPLCSAGGVTTRAPMD